MECESPPRAQAHLLKRVLIITAAHGTILRSLDRYGIFAVIKKPFDLNEFRGLVKEVVQQGVAQQAGGGIVARMEEPKQPCPASEHLWRESDRAPSGLDVVTELCESAARTHPLHSAYSSGRNELGWCFSGTSRSLISRAAASSATVTTPFGGEGAG